MYNPRGLRVRSTQRRSPNEDYLPHCLLYPNSLLVEGNKVFPLLVKNGLPISQDSEKFHHRFRIVLTSRKRLTGILKRFKNVIVIGPTFAICVRMTIYDA